MGYKLSAHKTNTLTWEICLAPVWTNPLSCGTSGGTVSLWVKSQCDGCIISSAANGRQGFIVTCSGTLL